MQEQDSSSLLQTPKKRAAVRRTQPKLWSEQQSEPSPTDPETVTKLQKAVNSLTKRLTCLEDEWQQVLEHLCEQEGTTECTTDEEEMN